MRLLARRERCRPRSSREVHILATPEFSGECTPDGTMIITIGLLEQLDTEDELAFVMGHELSACDLPPSEQRLVQEVAIFRGGERRGDRRHRRRSAQWLGGLAGANIARGLDVAQHLAKLSANVLMPQMAKNQEDAADALGFDLMVRAGYDPEAPLAVMDKLAEQEAEAAAAAQPRATRRRRMAAAPAACWTSSAASTWSPRSPAARSRPTRRRTSRSSPSTPPSTACPTTR